MALRKILCILLVLVPALALQAQQKYALVIGNGAYTNVTRLNNPVNDANDMAATLRGLGFQVDLVLNGNLDQMENGAVRLKNRLSTNANAYGFFFYAGHGVQSNGNNYLIPVDADIKAESFLRSKALQVQAVLDELNQAGNALNIVVLDACRDNPFSWGRSASRGLQVVNVQPADSIIVYATSAGKIAADGTGRNGVFTTHLLRNLKTPGLTVRDVFDRTGADVSRASNREQIPAIYSQFFGTAYLGGTVPQPAPQPAPAPSPRPSPTPAPSPSPAVVPPQPSPQPAPNNMVRINGGTFMMGSPEDETRSNVRAGETQHSVTVSSFYMAKYEVTQKEYLEITGKRISSVIEGGERITGDDLPVEGISWYDAVEYCNRRSEREGLQPAYTINKNSKDPNNKNNNDDELKWLVIWDKTANGYRLPTEAEWEYACRAGTTTRYNKGYTITTSQANYSLEYLKWAPPKAVGGFSPNAWGLYDMHGNVSEWCWDWYGRYPNSAQTNPTGPSSSEWRVNRGGSRTNEVLYARSASRNYWRPYFTMVGGGFRLVRNAQ